MFYLYVNLVWTFIFIFYKNDKSIDIEKDWQLISANKKKFQQPFLA